MGAYTAPQAAMLGISTSRNVALQSRVYRISYVTLNTALCCHLQRNVVGEGMKFASTKKKNVSSFILTQSYTAEQAVIFLGDSNQAGGVAHTFHLQHKTLWPKNTKSISRKRFVQTCFPTSQLADSTMPSIGPEERAPIFSSGDMKVVRRVRAFLFYATTCLVAIPLFLVMLIQHPFVMLFDGYKRKMHHLVNKIWAKITTYFFYKVTVEGWENLPGSDEPAVYVANHQSFLDIYTLFQLGRPFKFISKTSNFVIPIIGWSMYLTGHIPLRRMDRKSQVECLRICANLLKQGVSVFFFPEGTRSADGKMATFKKGAFAVASKANAPVVPITLIGTGKLMPNGMERTLGAGEVKVVIHPPIRECDAEKCCSQAWDAISQSLP